MRNITLDILGALLSTVQLNALSTLSPHMFKNSNLRSNTHEFPDKFM